MDSGLNAAIVYSIVRGDQMEHFSINSNTGVISVVTALDREMVRLWHPSVTHEMFLLFL